MVPTRVLVLLPVLMLSVIRLPPMVGNGLDEATQVCMQQCVELQNMEMTGLLEEVEERSLEETKAIPEGMEPSLEETKVILEEMDPSLKEMKAILEEMEPSLEESEVSWGALLFAAPLKQWQFWVVAGELVLLFGLFLGVWKRTHVLDSSDEQESSSNITEEEDKKEREKDFHDEERLVREKIRHSTRSLACTRQEVETLVGDLLGVFRERFSKRFFPVLQPAIGVGSTFEGWSPRGHDAVYSLLVPLKPPRGHAFHLELGTAGDAPAKHRVCVELVCTCAKETRGEDMLCFVHQPHKALENNQDSSLLSQLCTGRYLDAKKIARWFQDSVSSAWQEMPHSRLYGLRVLPSRRSCKLELTSASGRSLCVEMLFGMQRGNSDIFLSSEAPEAIFTPGTMWAESSAVAEAKFFSHVARQAPHDSVHLQCLQLCASSLVGTVLSSYTFKTIVMHVLNMYSLTSWTRVVFAIQLQDVMCYLRSCLQEKRLNHFIFGNECLPENIILPRATQPAKPLNLFQSLAQDPEAYAKALSEFQELQDQLTGLMLYRV